LCFYVACCREPSLYALAGPCESTSPLFFAVRARVTGFPGNFVAIPAILSSFWRDALVRAERRSLRGCARGSDGDGDTRLRKTLEAFLLVVWSPIVIFQ
jgi:hypothetical protein